MVATAPHFVLFSQSGGATGHWQFVLASADGRSQLVASDVEPDVAGERLELLSVVRGLEALDQPSRVTVVTGSRYVRHGFTRGLAEWRENDWCWERFGKEVPVKHQDLWQRIDRALKFHHVECRTWRFDGPHRPPAPIQRPTTGSPERRIDSPPLASRGQAQGPHVGPPRPKRRAVAAPRQSWWGEAIDGLRQRLGRAAAMASRG